LERLPLEDVLVLGQVAEYVEVAESVELTVQFASALRVVAAVVLRLCAECAEDVCAELWVGSEVADPLDELIFDRSALTIGWSQSDE